MIFVGNPLEVWRLPGDCHLKDLIWKVCGEPTVAAVVAVAMVVRVTNEPWRAREELPPIEGPRR